MHNSFKNKNNGFTLVELIITIGIFALMTSLMLAKYGNFDQGTLLTNTAFDIALSIRSAQSYGMNVRSVGRNINSFEAPYGVHFDNGSNTYKIYANTSGDLKYDDGDTILSTITMKRGHTVSFICADNAGNCLVTVDSLDIIFQRPDPNAIILINGQTTRYIYSRIKVMASDGSTRSIVVRSTGQISVE